VREILKFYQAVKRYVRAETNGRTEPNGGTDTDVDREVPGAMTPPTRRPTDAAYLDERDGETGVESDPDLPRELLNLPWVDVHNHAHTLSWGDRERYALSGCRAMVMVASGYHWTPYKPVRAEDVRYLWDDAINRRAAIERNHFFEANLGLGIHTGVRIENPDDLVDAMADYAALDEVAAIGETGVVPAQHVESWDLESQRAVVGAQMELADANDLPVILHTPNQASPAERPYRPGTGIPGYEKNAGLGQDPVIDADNPALESVKIDLDVAREAGLPEEQIVASHADLNNLEYLMAETDCQVSFTIGQSWFSDITAETVADAIDEYGPERIMMDTDAANVIRSEVFSLKRAIFELYQFGIDVDAIRQVVLENPREVFGIGLD
jgi:predicted metal-dependent TIM-barrel fold hydrolase